MKRVLKIFLLLSGFTLVLFTSCSKISEETKTAKTDKQKPDETKTGDHISSAGVRESDVDLNIEYFKPRKIYKIEKEDLNNDKVNEIIVLSVIKDTSQKYVSFYNFDMMEVFSLDKTKGKFEKIFSDTVDYSVECKYEVLEKNGFRQILISTNTGGNDKITSNGLFIFGMNSIGKINLINYFDSGDPVIKDIKNDNTKQILVSDQYWGVMPERDVIDFVRDIYVLENNSLVLKNSVYPEFYIEKIGILKEKYYGLKKKIEMGMQPGNMAYPLYREATEVIVNYYAQGDIQELAKFWNEEKDSLQKNIPEDEFTDLSNFVFKVIPAAKNA
ncbi:MAG TPA: hypothetical protein PKD83_12330 [Ignavibacteria bacterium]|nr:hypothetical protein [Ignavibacteria bacterium]